MLVNFTSYPFNPRIYVITALRMHFACTRYKCGDNKAFFIGSLNQFSKGILAVMHRSGINVELFRSHSTSAVATSKASVYSLPLDQILPTSDNESQWSSTSTFVKFYN